MATVNITTSEFQVKLEINGRKLYTSSEPLISPTGSGNSVVIVANEFRDFISMNDTITINGDVFTPSDFDEFISKMFEVFHDANSGSGGSGSFSELEGSEWDGSNRTIILTEDTELTMSTTKSHGILEVIQDETGGWGLSINGELMVINDGAEEVTAIGFIKGESGQIRVFVELEAITLPDPPVTPNAPTAGVVDDDADTFNWTNNPSFTNVSDYETTVNGGTNWITAVAKPLVVGNVAKAIGQVGVRVKAVGANPASAAIFNSTAFNSSSSYGATATALFDKIIADGEDLSTPQKDAWNTAIEDMIAAGIDTDLDFFHILCGGSAIKSKYNIFNPLDTDAAHRISFVNGATHSTNGVTNNGTNQYIDPFYIMTAAAEKADTDDYHIGVYSRTAAGVAGFTFGVLQAGNGIYLLTRATDNNSYIKNTNSAEVPFADATTGKGYYFTQTKPTGSPAIFMYKDGVVKHSQANSGAGNTLPTLKMLFNAYNNNGTISQYSTRQLSLIHGGRFLNDTKRLALEGIVAQLVTDLGL